MTTTDEKPQTPSITMTPIESSSQIKAIGYDASTRMLAVTFIHSGSTYHYADVPPEKHAALMAAESKGSHLGKHIKGQHEYKKIGAAPTAKPQGSMNF